MTTTNTNDETRELLIKARKGSIASFGPKHYQAVFEALGWTVTVGKSGREITSVTFSHPDVGSFTETKSPGYRIVTFYDLGRWLDEKGYDLSGEAAKLLGLPTVAEEREGKKLDARDFTNTGTCPVCEMNVKMRKGVQRLVHHGYERPGDGYIVGDCFGVGYAPWELSSHGKIDFLSGVVRPRLEHLTRTLARLDKATCEKVTVVNTRSSFGYRKTEVTEIARGDADFEYNRRSQELAAQAEHGYFSGIADKMQAQIAAWKLDTLPEEKMKARKSR